MPERPRELAQHGVRDHHRGELAAREHVAADRQGVGREVLDDALVEALVAAAQQRELLLLGELVDEAVVEQPASGDERDHAALRAELDGVDAVEGAQRRIHDVHAQHHAGAAAERRVVDLAAGERRVEARVERAHLVTVLERVAHVALRAEPVEPLREERDHVQLHYSASSPRNRASTSMRRAVGSTDAIASCTSGTS